MSPTPDTGSEDSSAYTPISQIEGWLSATTYPADVFEYFPTSEDTLFNGFSPEGLEKAHRQILRAAAFETGAIEEIYSSSAGVTMTIANEEDGWEESLAEAGRNASTSFNDQLQGYGVARDFARTQGEYPLTEAFVRNLHKIATASQLSFPTQTQHGASERALEHGSYKTSENRILNRFGKVIHFCPPRDVASEMAAAIAVSRELNQAGNAIVESAFLHWAITHIHPFSDGNGRVARIVASIPLFRTADIPLLIFSDRKQGYFQALEAADNGEPQQWIDFCLARVSDSIDWFRSLVESARVPDASSAIGDIQRVLVVQQQTSEPPQVCAERVRDYLFDRIERNLRDIVQLGPVTAVSVRQDHYVASFDSWRPFPDSQLAIEMSTPAPLPTTITLSIEISYARSSSGSHVVRIAIPSDLQTGQLNTGSLQLRTEDCSPTLGIESVLRLNTFAESFFKQAVFNLSAEVSSLAKSHGRMPPSS